MTTNGAIAANGRTATGNRGRVIGVAGLKNVGGMVQEEYLRILQSWDRAVKIYTEMRDDTTVATLLDAIKLPLLSADFDVTPFSDAAQDVEAADWLWENMDGMNRQSWRSHVTDTLEALDFGFYIGEIVFEKREDGRLWLRGIEPRGQETLDRWEFDADDKTLAFIQRDPDTGARYIIPLEKTVHIAYRGRKGNPQGQSLLRAVYRLWKFKKEYENFEGIGMERNVGGMPVATLPEEPLADQDLTDLRTALKNLRIDEEMYMILPAGMELNAYAGQQDVSQLGEVIRRLQQEIYMRGFAQFLTLGMGKVGTQSLVQGSQDFFAMSLQSIQQVWLEAWNQQLVPLLFNVNAGAFGALAGLPTVTWNDPETVDVKGLLEAYKIGVDARVLTPVLEDEEHIRAIMDLPDLPEGEGTGPRDALVETPFMPGGAGAPKEPAKQGA
jgi:hypothetical protein